MIRCVLAAALAVAGSAAAPARGAPGAQELGFAAGFASVDSVSLSGNGNVVVFAARKTSSDPPHVYVYDIAKKRVDPVDVTPRGALAGGPATDPRVSADGRYVSFGSEAPDLVAGDTNGKPDAFVRDRVKRRTIRVSVRKGGGELRDGATPYNGAGLSPDGRVAVFLTASEVFPGWPKSAYGSLVPGWGAPYAHYLDTGRVVAVGYVNGKLASVASTPSVSRRGQAVAFTTGTPLSPADREGYGTDAYVWTAKTGPRPVSKVADRDGTIWDRNINFDIELSDDGRFLTYAGGRRDDVSPLGGGSRAVHRDLRSGTVTDFAKDFVRKENSTYDVSPDGASILYLAGQLGTGPNVDDVTRSVSLYAFAVKKGTHTRIVTGDPACEAQASIYGMSVARGGRVLFKHSSPCAPLTAKWLLVTVR